MLLSVFFSIVSSTEANDVFTNLSSVHMQSFIPAYVECTLFKSVSPSFSIKMEGYSKEELFLFQGALSVYGGPAQVRVNCGDFSDSKDMLNYEGMQINQGHYTHLRILSNGTSLSVSSLGILEVDISCRLDLRSVARIRLTAGGNDMNQCHTNLMCEC